ncbi:hypothetical protein EVAR_74822_1 [Eumeta japonica]|uniref:Uncharacterized protein n=1 Tax=Eumeta variegata TaxID=151549 RepID=A0A4C1SS98_EUMVA|nr:hypothetical protein EVAR_74822_1 [Eumeta japonica]
MDSSPVNGPTEIEPDWTRPSDPPSGKLFIEIFSNGASIVHWAPILLEPHFSRPGRPQNRTKTADLCRFMDELGPDNLALFSRYELDSRHFVATFPCV